MSVRIQYAYLKQQTWLYRRNYPKELQPVLGQAYKQSLKTGDARVAKARAAEVNAKYEEIITKAKAGRGGGEASARADRGSCLRSGDHRGQGQRGGAGEAVPQPPVQRAAARGLQVGPLLGGAVRLALRTTTDRAR